MIKDIQTKKSENSIYFKDQEIELLANIINSCETKIEAIIPEDALAPYHSFCFEQKFLFEATKLPILRIITKKIKDMIKRYEEANDKKLLFGDKR